MRGVRRMREDAGKTGWIVPLIATIGLFISVVSALGAYHGNEPWLIPEDKDHHGVFALEGEFVHNVGELQMNITNWGLIGSRPGFNAPYSDAPSAMWPAGSGVDYLWAAGLWVGSIKNGVPLVSTGQYTPEFLANADDPFDTVYEMQQGQLGGARFPDPAEDDDGDGLIDEDPVNMVDDDLDGLVDEDFAAIGNQHFRCVMKDNTALSVELFPDHDPQDIEVVQESFAWEGETVDDFIGFQFKITNIGVNPLADMFIGFFADCDVGPRGGAGIAEDDLPGFFDEAVRAKDGSLVPVSVAYMYDADGDGGQATGFFGMLFLNHETDVTGERYPEFVEVRSFQAFSGRAPFDRGGDPTNDSERYELLSRDEHDPFPPMFEESRANDFRILVANGPFSILEPAESITFQAAMVCGDGLDGLVRNSAEAALTYYGAYFDQDVDPSTGIKGRETKICMLDFGPPGPLNPIFQQFQDCVDSLDLEGANPPAPIGAEDLDPEGCIYVNADCPFEERRGNENCTADGTGVDASELAGCTGVLGQEANVPWLVGLAPDTPDMRIWETDGRVHLFWNNMSELVPDVRLQKIDFESYRIWRADNWDRPFGSSIENGPESRLWRLIAEFDKVDYYEDRRTVNGVDEVQILPLGANTGLDIIRHTPEVVDPESELSQDQDFIDLKNLVDQILEANPDLNAGRDPAVFVRYQDASGEITPIGQQFPALEDVEIQNLAQLDTLYWDGVGVEFYEYVDHSVHNGVFHFYSVTASDFNADSSGEDLIAIGPGLVGDPQSNFTFAVAHSGAQTAEERDQFGHDIYVVPNPATRESLEEFCQLNPNSDDPTGVRVMFSNLPAARNTVKIFTLAGDLVQTFEHDGTDGDGSLFWNLVSRNGQEIVSGIYLFSVESSDSAFDRVIGRFVVIR